MPKIAHSRATGQLLRRWDIVIIDIIIINIITKIIPIIVIIIIIMNILSYMYNCTWIVI